MTAIAQIDLFVRSLEGAAGFYRDTLGLRELAVSENLALFDCGGVRIALRRAARPKGNSPVYFRVDDMESAAAGLKSRGVILDREPHLSGRLPDHDVWIALFHDPEGNSLGLVAEVR